MNPAKTATCPIEGPMLANPYAVKAPQSVLTMSSGAAAAALAK